jgi:hypothetical protein
MGNSDIDGDGKMTYMGFEDIIVNEVKNNYLFNILTKKKDLVDIEKHRIES